MNSDPLVKEVDAFDEWRMAFPGSCVAKGNHPTRDPYRAGGFFELVSVIVALEELRGQPLRRGNRSALNLNRQLVTICNYEFLQCF
jgi:hypothetical protein